MFTVELLNGISWCLQDSPNSCAAQPPGMYRQPLSLGTNSWHCFMYGTTSQVYLPAPSLLLHLYLKSACVAPAGVPPSFIRLTTRSSYSSAFEADLALGLELFGGLGGEDVGVGSVDGVGVSAVSLASSPSFLIF